MSFIKPNIAEKSQLFFQSIVNEAWETNELTVLVMKELCLQNIISWERAEAELQKMGPMVPCWSGQNIYRRTKGNFKSLFF